MEELPLWRLRTAAIVWRPQHDKWAHERPLSDFHDVKAPFPQQHLSSGPPQVQLVPLPDKLIFLQTFHKNGLRKGSIVALTSTLPAHHPRVEAPGDVCQIFNGPPQHTDCVGYPFLWPASTLGGVAPGTRPFPLCCFNPMGCQGILSLCDYIECKDRSILHVFQGQQRCSLG